METHNTREVEEVNYETRDYDGIRWIRYDHYEHALHHQLQKAREEAWVDGFMATGEGYNGEYCRGHGGNDVTRDDILKIYHSELDQDSSNTN